MTTPPPPPDDKLGQIVGQLLSRPGSARHETVRTAVRDLLIDYMGVPMADVELERAVPEVRGRIDALLGRTVFEFKSDLKREQADGESRLADYVKDRAAATGHHYTAVLTDGFTFIAYELVGGTLRQIQRHTTARDKGRELVRWLESVVATRADIEPEPQEVKDRLGRDSAAYAVASRILADLWQQASAIPEVQLKRQLWSQQLELVYGSDISGDDLWLQHTYLTIVAKTMATAVVGLPMPADPADLLSGREFERAGIYGAVESDFFDWVLHAPGGAPLVALIAREVQRFRLAHVATDVLKGLYESLIDPETRHELGEYYTPDWLAARICEHVIDRPLDQRVLDPACGSGTFLFHAVRRYLDAAEAAGMPVPEAVGNVTSQVLGVDVHPVAAIIARVTYLLAIGEARLRAPGRPRIAIPVYLGDALQWNTTGFLAEGEVLIGVSGTDLFHFPAAVARDPAIFDAVVSAMLEFAAQHTGADGFRAWLGREYPALGVADVGVLAQTYATLKQLYDDGRNHIWGYVARNMSRPVWLSSTGQRADVIVGNPPWLSYRYMAPEIQARFQQECVRRGLWAGGKVATHQDLSGYFFARCVELYLKADGRIAFVMPYAALNRKQFEGFRTGWWGTGRGSRVRRGATHLLAEARFMDAWSFDEHVKPLFPVPSCVLIAEHRSASGLPAKVLRASGTLPRRDASPVEAAAALTWTAEPWPSAPKLTGGSPYRAAFRQGATLVPRMLCIVEREDASPLGGDPNAPVVHSRRTSQEKAPWKLLPGLRGPVEREFLRPALLGESIAPYRILGTETAVIPWDPASKRLLDSAAARSAGYPRLARWLQDAEDLWKQFGGSPPNLVAERWDYHSGLTNQLPPARLRLVYSASGANVAAAVLRDSGTIAEHKLYWAAIRSIEEGRYLAAVFNSNELRSRVQSAQSRGQWGARDIDKVIFDVAVPRFDPSASLHTGLAAAAQHAESVAAAVDVSRVGFVRARGLIRDALRDDGIAAHIDTLVERLLGPA